jgi:hypothetical protein
MGDGKTFEQAVRALDKLIAEQSRDFAPLPPEPDPVQRAYERIVSGGTAPAR